MNWDGVSRIADVIGIIGFVFSVISLVFNILIFSRIKVQKNKYRKERKNIYDELCSLREVIWDDQIATAKIRDQLHTTLESIRQCFPLLLSVKCFFHIWHCIHLLKKDDFANNQSAIRYDLNYIIARLTKKE